MWTFSSGSTKTNNDVLLEQVNYLLLSSSLNIKSPEKALSIHYVTT